MITRLEIENFYSIRDRQIIDLTIGNQVPEDREHFSPLRDGSAYRVPKTIAMMGANASGKSNVLKALSFVFWFLTNSSEYPADQPFPWPRFFDGNTEDARIKVFFEWSSSLKDKGFQSDFPIGHSLYSYEAVFAGDGVSRPVAVSEALRLHPPKQKSRRVFQRDSEGNILGSTEFPLTGMQHVLSRIKPLASLSATLRQFVDHEQNANFVRWARRTTGNIFLWKVTPDEQSAFSFYAERPQLVEKMNQTIQRLDVGIEAVNFVSTATGPQPLFKHRGLSSPLQYNVESEGTKQFLMLYPFIWSALGTGGIAVLDELDSNIHPMILPEIFRWFRGEETNPHQAQLWLSGHSPSLLEELGKEEVYFTEKDASGQTNIFGLRDIEGVRRTDNFYQKYMGGVYGAVPRIG